MNAQEIIALEQQYVVQTYKRPEFVLAKGSGLYVYDTEGKSYLDFLSGIAVNALGHRHPAVVQAIEEQTAKLLHVCNLYHTAPQALLARDLAQSTPAADRVYFCNSGTEAVEACIKFARKWGQAHPAAGGQARRDFVAFEHSFHGRTMGALALTYKERYRAPFVPVMPGAHFAPYNDPAAARQLVEQVQPCAVIVEAVQGEGGVYPASPEFLQELRTVCDENDALLICDEIQCGLGRTGALWGFEPGGILPDLIAVAKPLGGGLPIGAALVAEKVAALLEPGDHGSTFAANPLICAVARAVLGVINEPEFLAGIGEKGDYMHKALNDLAAGHECITEVRGRGLIWGVDTTLQTKDILAAGYENGILLGSSGEHTVRLLPPYTVNKSEIDQAVGKLAHIFDVLEN